MSATSPPLAYALSEAKIPSVGVEFRLVEIDRVNAPLNLKNPNRKHLIFILEGCIAVGYNLFQPAPFSAGEMLFLPALIECSAWTLSPCTLLVLSYDNTPRLYDDNDITTESLADIDYHFKSLSVGRVLSTFLDSIRNYLQLGVTDSRVHEVKQQELFILFSLNYSKRMLIEFFYPVLSKVSNFRNLLLVHGLQAPSVKHLATILGYSERRFRDIFCAEFNEMPYKWLQKQKAKHIVMRLSQTDMMIKELIEELGFSSPSHFHKFCIKHYQRTPGQLKRELSAIHHRPTIPQSLKCKK